MKTLTRKEQATLNCRKMMKARKLTELERNVLNHMAVNNFNHISDDIELMKEAYEHIQEANTLFHDGFKNKSFEDLYEAGKHLIVAQDLLADGLEEVEETLEETFNFYETIASGDYTAFAKKFLWRVSRKGN